MDYPMVCPLLVHSVFLCHKVLNMIEDRLIFDLILHESLLPRGCDRDGQALMLRPPPKLRSTGTLANMMTPRQLPDK